MPTTYFTSDLHIGHRLVAGKRGFWQGDGEPGPTSEPDVDSHNRAIVDAWKGVKSDDVVWILGDLVCSGGWWTNAMAILQFLPGRKRLVCGNHDPVSGVHRDAWKYQASARHAFETIQDYAKVKIGPRTVLLSHYPYSGIGAEGLRGVDQTQKEERYTEFRLTDCGTPLLHGHTHGPEKLHFSERGTPQVHVGMDAWNMKLVPSHFIEKLLDTPVSSARVEAQQTSLPR